MVAEKSKAVPAPRCALSLRLATLASVKERSAGHRLNASLSVKGANVVTGTKKNI